MSKHRILSIALSVILVAWIIHFAANHMQHAGEIKGHTVPARQGPSALVRSLRPNYPYSVIPGGAYSQGELQYAHGNDSLVREHYSNFDIKHARLVNLTEDRLQYVSYRLKDQIYWTKRKLRIPKGELLLTDGVSYARTRCGNRLSDTPHEAATSPQEPDPKVLSLPAVTPEMLPKMALATPPSLGEIPSIVPLTNSQSGASITDPAVKDPSVKDPGLNDPSVTTVLPPLPEGPILTGFAPAPAGGLPVLTTGGTPPSGGAPATPGTTLGTTPPTSTTPATSGTPVNTPPPADPIPVPEPGTIYLFLMAAVVISVLAMLRSGPKDSEN
jgi:hypothetical protein